MRDSANLTSCVCFKILCLILRARCSFSCSASLRRFSQSFSVTFEQILIYLF